MRHRRAIRTSIACLLSGLAITLATAWLGPAAEELFRIRTSLTLQRRVERQDNLQLLDMRHVHSPTRDVWQFLFFEEHERWGIPPQVDETGVTPSWVRTPDIEMYERRSRPLSITAAGSGYPLSALHYEFWVNSDWQPQIPASPQGGVHVQGAWALGSCTIAGRTVDLTFPFRPIWRGFIADVAIWSGGSALVFAGFARLRRALRRRRNHCPHCNYARAGLTASATCPECGSR